MQHATPAHVHEIQPGAVHSGTVYDQTVVVELLDGTDLELFDSTVTSVTEEMVGEQISVVLFAQVRDSRSTERTKGGISITDNGYKIVGKLSKKSVTNEWFPDDETELAEIDFDIGHILIDTNDIATLEVGDSINISAFRLDIIGVSSS
jgi:hypothetical protein